MRFENEVSPEELFNMFFGGGSPGGGMQFGGPLGGANGTYSSPLTMRFAPHLDVNVQCGVF